MRYLLDTNIVSEPLRPRPDAEVLRRLREHDGEIAIPALVWHELRFGCCRLPQSRRREVIERYVEEVVLERFEVVDYDRRAADWHARERARLAAVGTTPPVVDGQIAAIAAVNGLTLVTANTSDFAAFDDLDIERWL